MTSTMSQDHNLDNQIEKQMGCMAGFFQLFDRHHILNSKKFHSTKRLTSPSVVEVSDSASTDVSKELAKPEAPKRPVAAPSPERQKPCPSPKLRQPLSIFDLKEGTKSSWMLKESSRLSLDSRATYDAKGNIKMKEIRADRLILPASSTDEDEEKQKSRSSTSVIARLMGLEPASQAESVKPAELRRCTSDSRFTRDLFQHRYIDRNDNDNDIDNSLTIDEPIPRVLRNGKAEVGGESKSLNKGMLVSSTPSWKLPLHRKSFFETEEAFPEPGQKQSVSVYGEIEKRLKMRGIDEVTKDLDTLKQILEVWQLKGLLHSKSHEEEQHMNYRNVVYDRGFPFEDSPVLVTRRMDPESVSYSGGGARRNLNIHGRERNVKSPTRTRGSSSPTGSERNVKCSNSIVKSKSLTVEAGNRVSRSTESRRGTSTLNSPSSGGSPRRTGSNQVGTNLNARSANATNRSPRSSKKAMAEIYHKQKISTVDGLEDESSSVSESSLSTPSQSVANEGLKVMEWKEGRNVLERCDKLLKSIGEMNATEQQSSPVSVLDSSFYGSAASPSPIMKRTIQFKENSEELQEEEGGSQLILSNQGESEDASEDSDLLYISEILRTYNYFRGDCDIFAFLENQQCLKGKDTYNKVSRLQRKLIFDTINEMLEHHRRLPPWKAFSRLPLAKIWSEFQRIRGAEDNRDNNDLVEMVCGVVTKDLARDGWGECPVELSAVILDIERMIFRDLVTESIGDLAFLVAPRRRLVF